MKKHSKALLNPVMLQEHLLQYYVNFVPNPSDDSDFEDTTYEADIEYEKEKKARKLQEEQMKKEVETRRAVLFEKYFDEQKDKRDSIFNCKGIKFIKYTHKFISLEFRPSEVHNYIPKHRIFNVILVYNSWYKRWILRRYHIPNRYQILSLYLSKPVVDDDLIDFLFNVYKILLQQTQAIVQRRKEKHKLFLHGKDVEISSDDELIFFTPEEREERKRKIEDIWSRMLPQQ